MTHPHEYEDGMVKVDDDGRKVLRIKSVEHEAGWRYGYEEDGEEFTDEVAPKKAKAAKAESVTEANVEDAAKPDGWNTSADE